jgi:hypothetical protein
MPTRHQIVSVTEDIADVASRRYVVGDGHMCGCKLWPEGGGKLGSGYCYPFDNDGQESIPFAQVPGLQKVELLATYVSWRGFDENQQSDVIRRVLRGESTAFWMTDIIPDDNLPRGPEIEQELEQDRDPGQKRAQAPDRVKPKNRIRNQL